MTNRVWAIVVVQLCCVVLGLWCYDCDGCVGWQRFVALPMATTAVPAAALLAGGRVATEPSDAVAGFVYLTVAAALLASTLRWWRRGGPASGVLLMLAWLGSWSWSLSIALELHVRETHDRFFGC